VSDELKCGRCDKSGVRLYRPYGEFRRPSRDRCNACVPAYERGLYVPVLPAEAIELFERLPESDPLWWTWERGWSAPPPLVEFARDCRDNWDCDEDAHRHGTTCRKCAAAEVLDAWVAARFDPSSDF
jgi:hypothetical protein